MSEEAEIPARAEHGRERKRWEFFITGEACEEMNRAEKDANNMEIVFSGAVGDWIRQYKGVSPLCWPTGDAEKTPRDWQLSRFSPDPTGGHLATKARPKRASLLRRHDVLPLLHTKSSMHPDRNNTRRLSPSDQNYRQAL